MNQPLTLDDLRHDPGDTLTRRPRPAVSEAEVAPCCCPELCMRDHEND